MLERSRIGALHIYGIEGIPSAPVQDELPCGFPVFFRADGQMEKPNVSASTGDVTVNMDFLFLIDKPGRKLDISTPTASVLDAVDEYLDALMDDPDLDDTLDMHLRISIEYGVYPWLDRDYAGFIARHTWTFLRG